MPKTLPLLLIGLTSATILAYGMVEATNIDIDQKVEIVQMEIPSEIAGVRIVERAAAKEVTWDQKAKDPKGDARSSFDSFDSSESFESSEPESVKSINKEEADYLPVVDQEDIKEEDKKLLNDILMWLPSSCRESLDYLVVRYDPEAPRGQSTSSTILIRGGMPRQETISIMIHECGHIVDLGYLGGTIDSGESVYPDGPIPTYNNDLSADFYSISWKDVVTQYSNTNENDFVSGYASSDPFEDFAESFILYALHNDSFKKMASQNEAISQKYDFMRNFVFESTFEPLSGAYKLSEEERVWDITKLVHDALRV
jgi:hypothetical protein